VRRRRGLEAAADGLIDLYVTGKCDAQVSNSRTHGGFDNDPKTLNDVLRGVPGEGVALGVGGGVALEDRGFSAEMLRDT